MPPIITATELVVEQLERPIAVIVTATAAVIPTIARWLMSCLQLFTVSMFVAIAKSTRLATELSSWV